LALCKWRLAASWSAKFSRTTNSMSINMDNRIKEIRNKLGMTQEDLAQKAGVRRETIVFLEQGKYNPSLKLANDVAKSLRKKIQEVFILD